jgi:hypothetical protein
MQFILSKNPPFDYLLNKTHPRRYHQSCEVKEGIGGFKMTPIQFKRTMFWFAARTAWMVTKTAGGLILTRTAGDKFRATKELIRSRTVETGLKPVTNFITGYFTRTAVPNGATKLRNALFNIARLVYGTVLSFLTYLTIELYNISHILVSEASKYLVVVFNLGKEFLIKLTGPLSDLMMVAYTLAYLIALAFLVYVIFRLVHHVLYNLFTFRSMARAIIDTVTEQAEGEQKEFRDNFLRKIVKSYENSPIAGEVNFRQLDNGDVIVHSVEKFEDSYLGQQVAETKRLEEEHQKQNSIVTNKKKK